MDRGSVLRGLAQPAALAQPPTGDLRLAGRQLALARILWAALFVSVATLVVAGIPLHYAQLQRVTSVKDVWMQLSPGDQAALLNFGLGTGFYAAVLVFFQVAVIAIYLAVSLLIFVRRSDEVMGIFAATVAAVYGSTSVSIISAVGGAYSAWRMPIDVLTTLGVASTLLLLYLFPDGRFVPRRIGGLAAALSAWVVLWPFVPAINPDGWAFPLPILVRVGLYATGVFAQLYRYHRHASSVERQQTKWVVFGFTAPVVGFLVFNLPYVLDRQFLPQPIYVLVAFPLLIALPSALAPLSLAFAVLRHRLWDIDILIHRSLVYVGVTSLSAVVYVVTIILLQDGLRRLTGRQTNLVLVASTLVIAALFNPLRQYVQAAVDRRLYRRRYETAQVLATFGATVRDEVNLTRLTADLLATVERTVRPASVSLWLRGDVSARGWHHAAAAHAPDFGTPETRAADAASVRPREVQRSRPLLGDRALRLARAAWLAVAVLTIGLFALAVPLRFEQLRTICLGAICVEPQLTLDDVRALQSLGMPIVVHAAFHILLEVTFAAVYFAVAAVIFARKSQDRMALFVGCMLLTFGAGSFTGTLSPLADQGSAWRLPLALASPLPGIAPELLGRPISVWQLPVALISVLGQTSAALFFYLFPDGRFVPRWTRVLALAWVGWQIPAALFPTSPFNADGWPPLLSGLVWAIFLGSYLFAQLYRYRRVADPVQRQQTKWVVWGVTGALTGLLGSFVLTSLFSPVDEPGLLYREALTIVIYVSMLLIPISIGAAILRSRLWAIDLLINRTLVYGALTLNLAVVYFGSVIVLQILFRGLSGPGQSELVVILSTLAIAGLFSPLRRRIQADIDRRFYRRKVDAAQLLAAFSNNLRDEVDLDRLVADLTDVVDEAMQPAHVTLWIRSPGSGE